MGASVKQGNGAELRRFGRRTVFAGIGIAVAAWALTEAAVLWGGPTNREIVSDYQSSARTPIFTSFFTMGSFLIALKTTILARIKDTYETQAYRDAYRARKVRNPNEKYYSGLEDLGRALGYNVVLCLFAAFTQMTLGFWANPVALAICVGVASSALILLVRLTFALMSAHKDWFLKIEEDMKHTLEKMDDENSKENAPEEGGPPFKCNYTDKGGG